MKIFAAAALCLPLLAEAKPADMALPGPENNAIGSEEPHPRTRFVYDVDFEFRFDNREYGESLYSPSMTVLGARLTPSAGLQIDASGKSRHRLMLGIDVMKDFGSDARLSGLFKELTLFYRWDTRFGLTGMTLEAGIFPRGEMRGQYSAAFFSEYHKFYDPNLEGLILKFRRPSAYYELGCDWMGQYGDTRRERFMIFASGEARLANRLLVLGYSGYLYHYAGSREVWGVVDNILLNPYIGADFSERTGLQSLRFGAGCLVSMQNDRRYVGHYTFPAGGEFHFKLRNWNICVENRLYYGEDLMPYYDSADAAGHVYGGQLYFGDPLYRVSLGGKRLGIYDRLEVYWEPHIADFLRLRVAAAMHFHSAGFSGWQQIVSLVFDLPSSSEGAAGEM